MNYHEIITIEPGKRSGRPCIRGMRIAVSDVLGWLAAGMSHAEILAEYPDLTDEDIRACLAYAADRERGNGYVIGREAFARISAVEGIELSDAAKNAFAEFDRRELSHEERRNAIIGRFKRPS
jgi:uncharacterized protein (DUF433 family)